MKKIKKQKPQKSNQTILLKRSMPHRNETYINTNTQMKIRGKSTKENQTRKNIKINGNPLLND